MQLAKQVDQEKEKAQEQSLDHDIAVVPSDIFSKA